MNPEPEVIPEVSSVVTEALDSWVILETKSVVSMILGPRGTLEVVD